MAALVGAVVGGYFAKAGAVQGAKTAADAIVRQVEEQRANELNQWIRTERRVAYGEVVRAHGELASRLAALRVAADRDAFEDLMGERVDEAWTVLSLACSGTHLFGPESVFQAADQVRDATRSCVIEHRAFVAATRLDDAVQLLRARQDLEGSRDEMRSTFTEFSVRAREALGMPT
ncbi:hypothetical protein [Streptomyces sp. NPDC051014]|uniref:hypothetical protein n=1 Tax=Streptomyces sp. NPDC051014 TaxID=3155751 RepID=UPI0033CD2C57